jgi:hypothetical protein
MKIFRPQKPALGTKATVDVADIQEDLPIRTMSNPTLMQPPGPSSASPDRYSNHACSYDRLSALGKQHSNKTTPSIKGIVVVARHLTQSLCA